MSQDTAISPRQRRVDRFFRAAFAGGVAWVLSFVLYLLLLGLGKAQEQGWVWLNFGLFLVAFTAIVVQFRSRNADEFTAEHWNAAASWAFIISAGWMFFAVLTERLIAYALFYLSGTIFPGGYAFFLAFHVPMFSFYAVFLIRYLKERS